MTKPLNPKIERLVHISRTKPLIPDEYVPWEDDPTSAPFFMPEKLTSLDGLPIYDQLTPEQKRELGRHEVAQVMYSYGWSEGLACLFFNRYLLTLTPDNIEYSYLIQMLIEEFRHQDMFAKSVKRISGKPILPSFLHNYIGNLAPRYMAPSLVFISVLAVEMITDIYGKMLRKSPEVYSVIRKVSELHHIEEGRHIYFTKMFLERYTAKAGFFKRTIYSLAVMLNVYFMRTLYVKKEIYERIGLPNPEQHYQLAKKHFKVKFAEMCLGETIEFVKSFNGFNIITQPLWKKVLGVKKF